MTEADLTRLVKKIVKEQDSMNDPSDDYFKMIDMIANYAVEEEGDSDELERCIHEIYSLMQEVEFDEEISDELADEIIHYGYEVVNELESMLNNE